MPVHTAPWARLIVAAGAVAVVTYVFAWLSLYTFTAPGTPSAVWWPVAGMVLVIVVRCPRRWWWVLLVIFGVVSGLASLPKNGLTATLTYSLVNVIEVLVAAVILHGAVDARGQRLRTPQEAVRFIGAIVASVGVGAVVVAARQFIFPAASPWHDITFGYITAHTLGLFSLVPLLLPGHSWWRASLARHAEFALVLVATVLLDWWVFLQPFDEARAFPVLLPVIWAAIRLDPVRATAISLLTCAIAAYGTAHGLGTFATVADVGRRQLVTQLLIATVSIVTLALVLITRHRARLAAQASDSEQTLRIAIREALVGIYSVRLDQGHMGEILDVNTALAQMLGYEPEELVGRQDTVFRMSNDASEAVVLNTRMQQLAVGAIDAFQRETRFAMKSGDQLWVELSATRLDPATSPPFALIYVHDLTGREQNKKMLESMALHDALTGLANRAVLFPRLEDLLRRGRWDGGGVGLLYLDLNGFKPVNDRYGHAAGDAVLVEVARRLEAAVRPGDTVARLGGDEFAVLAAGIAADDDLTLIADRIHAALAEPIVLPGGAQVTISSSIGAAVGTSDTTPDQLVRAADVAMYRAKHSGPPESVDGRAEH